MKAKKERKIKAWAVFWREEFFEDYGISAGKIKDRLVGCTVQRYLPNYIGVMKNDDSLYADIAIFYTRKDAEAYRQKNIEWKVAPITITYTPPGTLT